MAKHKLKSGKIKSNQQLQDDFRPEPESDVKVTELIRDERTHKVLGVFSLMVSLILFIAFSSYLFTWKEDQEKVFHFSYQVLFTENIRIANLLGRFGAFISHLFFFKGIGVASYLICYLFFIIGINLLVGRRVFGIWRNIRYIFFGLIFISTSLAFLFPHAAFPWGGAFGGYICQYLIGFLGSLGTFILLGMVGLV
ncbi:MAG: DNA translocase FtsK 4TM domain-containing protein, partial [Chitinophagaceae bacterium]